MTKECRVRVDYRRPISTCCAAPGTAEICECEMCNRSAKAGVEQQTTYFVSARPWVQSPAPEEKQNSFAKCINSKTLELVCFYSIFEYNTGGQTQGLVFSKCILVCLKGKSTLGARLSSSLLFNSIRVFVSVPLLLHVRRLKAAAFRLWWSQGLNPWPPCTCQARTTHPYRFELQQLIAFKLVLYLFL